jgi:predicted nuclease with TOPRIM domain
MTKIVLGKMTSHLLEILAESEQEVGEADEKVKRLEAEHVRLQRRVKVLRAAVEVLSEIDE